MVPVRSNGSSSVLRIKRNSWPPGPAPTAWENCFIWLTRNNKGRAMARRIIRSTPALRMVRLKWDHKCEQAVKTMKCYVRCRRQVLEHSDWRSPAKHPHFWRGMWRWGEQGSSAVIRKLVTEVGFTPTSLFEQSIIAGIFVMRKNKSRSKLAVSDTTFLHLLGAGGNSISWVTWKTGRSSGKYTVGSVSSGGDGLDDLIQEVFSISHFYDLIWLRPREHNKKVTTHHYVRQVLPCCSLWSTIPSSLPPF